MVKINTLTDLDMERMGREAVTNRHVADLRYRYNLSVRRLAEMLETASQVVARWENNPVTGLRMRPLSAIRLGRLMFEAEMEEIKLNHLDVQLDDLIPIGQVTAELGLSPSSKLIAEKCRTGEITCYNLGRFGVYIPYAQANTMLRRKG